MEKLKSNKDGFTATTEEAKKQREQENKAREAKKAKNGVSLCFVKQKDKLVLVKDEEGPIAMYELQSGKVYHCLRGLR